MNEFQVVDFMLGDSEIEVCCEGWLEYVCVFYAC